MPRRLAVAVTALLALSIPLSTPAWATDFHHTPTSVSKHHHGDDSQDDSGRDDSSGRDDRGSRDDSDTFDGATLDDPSSSLDSLGDMTDSPVDDSLLPSSTTTSTGSQKSLTIQRTGYGAPDNTPANSKTISMPVVHREAGGNCTWADPVTFASPGSGGSTEFPKGQRVYFPDLKCVGISEDSGATRMSIKHIDIYTGDGPKSVTDKCESQLTGKVQVIVNPPKTVAVRPGPLSDRSGCRFQASR